MQLRDLLLPLLLVGPLGAQDAERAPNIVVLLADDAGYADFGFQPSVHKDMQRLTPHIDSIAANGARFTDAYMTGCVCSPSRAGLMTGRYQGRFGHENNLRHWLDDGLPLSETLVSTRLHRLGYETGLVGKWHLGYGPAYFPHARDFHWFYGCLQGQRSYYPLEDPHHRQVLLENGVPTPESGYVTDRIGDAACRFIDEHHEEPFFLVVSFTAPHAPLEPRKGADERLAHIVDESSRAYAGLIVALDDNVGKVLDALRAAQLDDNTLVVFTNDNGGVADSPARNTPLRGHKSTLYEGGVRVPMAMRWPGHIAAGSVIEDPVSALDLLPTFVSLAGGTPQDDWKLDGLDLGPRLRGVSEALPERTLYWRWRGPRGPLALRAGRWKVVHNRNEKNSAPELYDLVEDVAESHDLAAEKADVLAPLLVQLAAWESELAAPLWNTRAPRDDK